MPLPSEAHRVGLLRGVARAWSHRLSHHRVSTVVGGHTVARYCSCGDWWWV